MDRKIFRICEFLRNIGNHLHKTLVLFVLRFGLDLKIKRLAILFLCPNLILGLIVTIWVIKNSVYSDYFYQGASENLGNGLKPFSTNTYVKNAISSSIPSHLNHSNKIEKLIINYSEKYEVEPSLIRALIKVESNFDPKAISSKGACGIMQLDEITQKELGLENPLILECNIEAGIRYFKTLLDMYDNDLECAIAAYNAGPTKVRQYGGVPPYRETKRHIRKVLRYYEQYKKLEGEKVGIVQKI